MEPSPTPQHELSIVVPVYNEQAVVGMFVAKLDQAVQALGLKYEILVIDDGSTDDTWRLIREMADRYPLRGIRFTRHFGKEAGILAGLQHADGQAVVVMDGDGQHPPELLPGMVAIWQDGCADIVAARKASRETDPLTTRINAWLFNRTMRYLTGLDLSGASDFRLLDRKVVDSLLAFPEKVRFFRGMTVWTGFRQENVFFDVAPRLAGDGHWSTAQLTRLAMTAIAAYSSKPLDLIFKLGFVGLLISLLLGLQALYSWFAGIAISGWTSLTFVILLFGSANLLGVGVLGAYLAQIFDEIKGRPSYLVREETARRTPKSLNPRIDAET